MYFCNRLIKIIKNKEQINYMKISNFHKIMVLLLMLIVSVVGFAQTEIDGHYYNLNNETKEAEFASVGSAYDHSTCTVIIPSTAC